MSYYTTDIIQKDPITKEDKKVEIHHCTKCGYSTEGKNLIEFHINFQCKEKKS